MAKGLDFSFDDVNESGFVVIRPGRYIGKVTDWRFYTNEDTGNDLFQIEFELVGGDYAGETIRMWRRVDKSTRTSLFRLYKNLGLIRDGDRTDDDKLNVTALFGETDDKGKVAITKLVVNGEERPVIGAKATLVIVEDRNQDGEKTHSIKYVDALSVTPDGDTSDLPF